MFACFWDSIRAPVNCLSLTHLAFYRRTLSNSAHVLDIPAHDASLLAVRAIYARYDVTLTMDRDTVPRCTSFGRPNCAGCPTRVRVHIFRLSFMPRAGKGIPLLGFCNDRMIGLSNLQNRALLGDRMRPYMLL